MTAAHRQRLVRYLGIWAAWLAVAVVTAFQTYAAGFAGGPKLALGQALVNGLIWYSAWAALTPGVVAVARAFADERRLGRLLAIHLAFGLLFAVLHAALYSAMNAMIYVRAPWAPWSNGLLITKLATSIHVHLMIYALLVAIVLGARAYRTMRDREVAAARLEAQLAEAETAVLRAQLQPHFLFNTLNAISALVPDDPIVAQRLIARLGDLLRLSIDQRRSQHSALADELDFTDTYLAIEEARLGERLRIVRAIAPGLETVQVPALLLQPLVENAVRHGIAPTIEGGTLTIEAKPAGDMLWISIADNGKGAGAIREGVGLGNARLRLRHLYGERQSLEIDTAPGEGFRVIILVPQ
ncbi:sensor histidine kinase [Sphingomonas sp. CFBP 13706]|uniref:sensor histidine kinase n=1 Tax=Sphingomonas sp. CFBP 13706 TaxID=2775314 RepID=UPI00177C6FB6|nr:sensor histidine kinase [Sphingomonas sp. CFBP 13706]MBD8737107.1 sensor histidine kinase [Sphingomonas sp. CFBP 13706]